MFSKAKPYMAWAIGLIVVGLSCDGDKPAPTPVTVTAERPAATEPSEKTRGTLLRIVCDIPGELSKPLRSHPANIGWSAGNKVRGQAFSLPLTQPKVEVQLQEVIPIGADVHIRFEVEVRPRFITKFSEGAWSHRTRIGDQGSMRVLEIPLSRFNRPPRIFPG